MDSLRFLGTQLYCLETVIVDSHFHSALSRNFGDVEQWVGTPSFAPDYWERSWQFSAQCAACLRIKMDFMRRQYPLNSSFLISKGAEIEIKCLNTLAPK